MGRGIVICSPEYFGYMAGGVKDFFDRACEELKDDAGIWKNLSGSMAEASSLLYPYCLLPFLC